MTKEEKRAYNREWYHKHREEIIAANKKRWQEYSEDKKKEIYEKRRSLQSYKNALEKNKEYYKTDEYRKKHREEYAKKHGKRIIKRDPITAKEAALKDMKREFKSLILD